MGDHPAVDQTVSVGDPVVRGGVLCARQPAESPVPGILEILLLAPGHRAEASHRPHRRDLPSRPGHRRPHSSPLRDFSPVQGAAFAGGRKQIERFTDADDEGAALGHEVERRACPERPAPNVVAARSGSAVISAARGPSAAPGVSDAGSGVRPSR